LVQNYKFAKDARWLFYIKNYLEAIIKYKTAFQYYKPQAYHLGDLVACYRGIKQLDSMFKYAAFCLENFGLYIERTRKDTIIDNYYSQKYSKVLRGILHQRRYYDKKCDD
jgi:hypothetical protein